MKPSADVDVAWMTTAEPTVTRLPGETIGFPGGLGFGTPPASGLTITVPSAKKRTAADVAEFPLPSVVVQEIEYTPGSGGVQGPPPVWPGGKARVSPMDSPLTVN